ncbi:MAG: ATP-binding protein [Nitrosomonas sp.]|nr:ATP-binding protein [Nitrosomonas sp.]
MKFVIVLVTGLSVIMLYLLATAGANTEFFERRYRWLIVFIAGFLIFLIGVVAFLLWRLRRRLKTGIFGSRLAVRLLIVFSLMAILPGALIYSISVQFLEKSIESWFDVKVDRALEGGLTLGQTVLDNLLEELQKRAQAAALSLSEPMNSPLTILNRLLLQSQIQEATLFNQDGKIVAFTSMDEDVLFPEIPNAEAMRNIRMQKNYRAVESLDDNVLYLRVLVPVNVLSPDEDIRVLQVLQRVPQSLADSAEQVQEGFSDYQELMLSRQGLTRLYSVTLTLALFLALFSAVATAFVVSEKLSAPLGQLADGTRAVAQGDFSRRHQIQSKDEFGVLTESFNLMTEQLDVARNVAQRNQQEVENARAYLENILANLSSGVIVFDEDLRMRAINQSAEQILQIPLAKFEGLTVEECIAQEPRLKLLAKEIRIGFASEEAEEWQRQVIHSTANKEQILLLRGSRLPQTSSRGGVVVFDDITGLLQVQRTVAWGEVARRLAHEIKNPLTPIQLSAERLQHKLLNKLDETDARILKRSTTTIVEQVEALKKMVNEFRDYARTPELELYQTDLNRLIREVLALYQTTINPENNTRPPQIEMQLASDLQPIKGDPARLRQVLHNLLQNSQDAISAIDDPMIWVRTESGKNSVLLSITDNGMGFPESIEANVFEPYITTKPKGTGLGLPIVKKIVDEHNGIIHVRNIQPHGAQVLITLPAMIADNPQFSEIPA